MSNTLISDEPDILEDIWTVRSRDLLDFDENKFSSQLGEFKELVSQQQDMSQPKDQDFYIKFLRAGKHDPNTALEILRCYHTLRKSHPQYFKISLNVEGELATLLKENLHFVLKHRDDHGRPIIVVRANSKWNPSKIKFSEMFAGIYVLSEMLSRDARAQIAGLTAILDVKDFGWTQFRAVGLDDLRNLARFFNLSFPLWLRECHVLHAPRAFQMLFTIARPFLSDSVRDGIVFHSGDLATLKQYFSRPELIPREVGGAGQFSLDNSHNLNDLRNMKDYFLQLQSWVEK